MPIPTQTFSLPALRERSTRARAVSESVVLSPVTVPTAHRVRMSVGRIGIAQLGRKMVQRSRIGRIRECYFDLVPVVGLTGVRRDGDDFDGIVRRKRCERSARK